jgi:hypothetical protein
MFSDLVCFSDAFWFSLGVLLTALLALVRERRLTRSKGLL